MSFLPGMTSGFTWPGVYVGAPQINYESFYTDTDGADPHTPSMAVGDANQHKSLLIFIFSGAIPVDVSIGGISATEIARTTNDLHFCYHVPWTGGGNETITVDLPSSGNLPGMAIYSVLGLQSSTPVDTAEDLTSNGGSIDVNVNEGGFVIGFASANSNPAISWHANFTGGEDFELDQETGSNEIAGAHAQDQSAATPLTLTCTISGASVGRVLCVSMR